MKKSELEIGIGNRHLSGYGYGIGIESEDRMGLGLGFGVGTSLGVVFRLGVMVGCGPGRELIGRLAMHLGLLGAWPVTDPPRLLLTGFFDEDCSC